MAVVTVHSDFGAQENKSCLFIGGIDAEAEAPILWPLDVKSQLIRKDPDARKD